MAESPKQPNPSEEINRRKLEGRKAQDANKNKGGQTGQERADSTLEKLGKKAAGLDGSELKTARALKEGNYGKAIQHGLEVAGQRTGQILGAFLGLPPNVTGAIGKWLAKSKIGKVILISIILLIIFQLLLIILLPFIIIVVVMSGGMIAICKVDVVRTAINSPGLNFFCGIVNAVQ